MAVAAALLAVLFWRLPGGFVPQEDQGRIQIQWRLPAGATQARTIEVRNEIEKYLDTYEKANVDKSTLAARIKHVMQASFNGRRIVVFSGGVAKDLEGLYTEIRGLRDGGANGSIIGRNTFQRPREDAIKMLDNIIAIYQGNM